MDPGRYHHLKALLQAALDVPVGERDAYLESACADDPDLLREARELLAQDLFDAGGEAADPDEPTLVDRADLADLRGARIGRYRILETIGEGGMGVVYLAAQSAPLRRKVALKVIKVGMDTHEVITRFASERQALALMDHPNIARVYDAGATPAGRPYFVMEYIPGLTLTRYCEIHGLDLQQRLDLVLQVCRGVHHAHQKGVIHRDIKPSNIIVTEVEGRPVPKIIDFGVAKATGQHLAARTWFTQLGRIIGTPEYMSPEQADHLGTDIDIRTDVFSLGVVLYELLTGELPISREELLRAGIDRIGSLVREKVPPRPSTRITTRRRAAGRAASRGSGRASGRASSPQPDRPPRSPTPGSAVPDGSAVPTAGPRSDAAGGAPATTPAETRNWVRRVRGDLDWITMKALEKDRERRYESAAAMAQDIERHLAHRTVEAGPPSRRYRLRKFIGRNRLGVGIAAALLVALVAFASWQTVQSDRIARERDRALASERLSLARGKLATDPTVAFAYALASLEIGDQPAARDVARQALAAGPVRDELPAWGERGNPIAIDASADGRLCATVFSQREYPTVGIYDLADYSLRVFEAPAPGIAYEVDLNADATCVVANGDAGVDAWRVDSGEHLWHWPQFAPLPTSCVRRLDDPGRMAICCSWPGEHNLWLELDLRGGGLRQLGRSAGVQADNGDAQEPAIDPAGRWILDYAGRDVFLQPVVSLIPDPQALAGDNPAPRVWAAGDAAGGATRLDGPGAPGGLDGLRPSGEDPIRRIGSHAATVSGVALARDGTLAVSMDVDGKVKVWDLRAEPARLLREFTEPPGDYQVRFDPRDHRFVTTWGSAIAHAYDLDPWPRRQAWPLRSRSHWVHDATFLPDGSFLTSYNGLPTGKLARWRLDGPVAWRLDLGHRVGRGAYYTIGDGGRIMLLWTRDGDVVGIPLAPGASALDGLLGHTGAVLPGMSLNIFVDDALRRCVTYCTGMASHVLDLQTGAARQLETGFCAEPLLLDVSEDGRLACFVDFQDLHAATIVDLDSGEVASSLSLPPDGLKACVLQGDTALVVLCEDVLLRCALASPDAAPDTLWQGDATGDGRFTNSGDAAVVRDGAMQLTFLDLVTGHRQILGTTPRQGLSSFDHARELGLVAIGGWWETIHVYDLERGHEWLIPAPGAGRRHTYQLDIDRQGRWIVSLHPDDILAWRLPLDPVFSTGLPSATLLESLRARTNVRVVADTAAPEGFRITNTLEQ